MLLLCKETLVQYLIALSVYFFVVDYVDNIFGIAA